MNPLVISLLALPLALGLGSAPASAGSVTNESVSRDLAVSRSTARIPREAPGSRVNCTVFGPTTHYRCTATWLEEGQEKRALW
ncbi:MAG: hypothetical protein VKI81_04600 [Synechococcaceae cyanobacterium]|nr:hypothetical protein [Synechococcaceae cyanobacterium]